MSRRLTSIFGLRSRTRDGRANNAQEAEPPQTTRQIQEMLDWQILENHFAQPPEDLEPAESMNAIPSSSNNDAAQQSEISLSARLLEHELLTKNFREAHAEVERRARELRGMVHQLGIIEDDALPEVQKVYTQLVKDSTELFSAIAQKMSRLRTKIDLSSSSIRRARPEPPGEASGAQTARSRRQPGDLRHFRLASARARDQSSSNRSHDYSELSARRSGVYNMPEDDNRPSSIVSAPSQGRSLGQRARGQSSSNRSHGYGELSRRSGVYNMPEDGNRPSSIASAPSQGRSLGQIRHRNAARSGEHASFEAQTVGYLEARTLDSLEAQTVEDLQARTLGDLPVEYDNGDLLNVLHQPSTFQELPQLDSERSSPCLE